jgi:hypothetical protein
MVMVIVTTSSLEQRTGPAWVHWVAPNGVTQQQQFDSVSDAKDLADKLYKDQQLKVWVRPDTGPIYRPEDKGTN